MTQASRKRQVAALGNTNTPHPGAGDDTDPVADPRTQPIAVIPYQRVDDEPVDHPTVEIERAPNIEVSLPELAGTRIKARGRHAGTTPVEPVNPGSVDGTTAAISAMPTAAALRAATRTTDLRPSHKHRKSTRIAGNSLE